MSCFVPPTCLFSVSIIADRREKVHHPAISKWKLSVARRTFFIFFGCLPRGKNTDARRPRILCTQKDSARKETPFARRLSFRHDAQRILRTDGDTAQRCCGAPAPGNRGAGLFPQPCRSIIFSGRKRNAFSLRRSPASPAAPATAAPGTACSLGRTHTGCPRFCQSANPAHGSSLP